MTNKAPVILSVIMNNHSNFDFTYHCNLSNDTIGTYVGTLNRAGVLASSVHAGAPLANDWEATTTAGEKGGDVPPYIGGSGAEGERAAIASV